MERKFKPDKASLSSGSRIEYKYLHVRLIEQRINISKYINDMSGNMSKTKSILINLNYSRMVRIYTNGSHHILSQLNR